MMDLQPEEFIDPIGVTITQACELLQVGRQVIEDMVDRGELTAFTIGAKPASGKLRISYESLKALPNIKKIDPQSRIKRLHLRRG